MDQTALNELKRAADFLREFLQDLEAVIDNCRAEPGLKTVAQVAVSDLEEVAERAVYLACAIERVERDEIQRSRYVN
jgi:hypothetical protein